MRGSSIPAITVVFLLGWAAAIGVGAPHVQNGSSGLLSAAGHGSITVAAVPNYGFQPNTFTNLPLNATIAVTFTDDDVLPHAFNISSREGFEIPTDYTTAQLNQLFAKYPPLYAASVASEGDVSVGNFTSPSTPGWYEFVCNVTGHFEEGMYGFVAFGEGLPSNLTLPHNSGAGGGEGGQGVNSYPVAIGGGVVLAVILIVAVLVWHRRQSERRSNDVQSRSSPPPSRNR